MCLFPFHVSGQSRLDGTLQFICTKGEYFYYEQSGTERRPLPAAKREAAEKAGGPLRRLGTAGRGIQLSEDVLLRPQVLQRGSVEAVSSKLRDASILRHSQAAERNFEWNLETEEVCSFYSMRTREGTAH